MRPQMQKALQPAISLLMPRRPGGLMKRYIQAVRSRALYMRAQPGCETDPILDGVIEEIDKIEKPGWNQVYALESALVQCFRDEAHLTRELRKRLAEAEVRLATHQAGYYGSIQLGTLTTMEEKRALLLQVLEDLHWWYKKETFKDANIQHISNMINWLVLSTFLVTAAAVVLLFLTQSPAHYRIGLTATAVGGLGSAFSLLVTMRRRLEAGSYEDTVRARSLGYLISRLLIGMLCGAAIFYFIHAGYLAGDFFPGSADLGAGNRDALSGLIVWSLVAGFSETMVPGLLKGYSRKAGKREKDGN